MESAVGTTDAAVTRRDRIAGGLLGVHAGDALGATVEFSSWESIRQRYPDGVRDIVGGGPLGWPPGNATDDTDLTRAVLLAYLQPHGDVVRAAAEHMLEWWSFSGRLGCADGEHVADAVGEWCVVPIAGAWGQIQKAMAACRP